MKVVSLFSAKIVLWQIANTINKWIKKLIFHNVICKESIYKQGILSVWQGLALEPLPLNNFLRGLEKKHKIFADKVNR